MDINKITVKEHLIGTLHRSTKSTSEKYFQDYLNDENMLNILFDLLENDESGDVRIGAAYWISKFDTELLKLNEPKLLSLMTEELDNISCHIFMSLAKIKSKKGMLYLINSKIEPDMYWEAQVLKDYIDTNS